MLLFGRSGGQRDSSRILGDIFFSSIFFLLYIQTQKTTQKYSMIFFAWILFYVWSILSILFHTYISQFHIDGVAWMGTDGWIGKINN